MEITEKEVKPILDQMQTYALERTEIKTFSDLVGKVIVEATGKKVMMKSPLCCQVEKHVACITHKIVANPFTSKTSLGI